LAGKASISNNLKALGIELPPDKEQILLERIKELGEKKATVTIDDLPFLIEDLFRWNSSHLYSR
jgi:D-citramalate synthase